MKTPQLSLLIVACFTSLLADNASAVAIFNDDMESYPTATTTSILNLANNVSSNPQFWSYDTFTDTGSVTSAAGITGTTGTRAALLTANFSAATGGFWGAQLRSPAAAGGGSGATTNADFSFSLTLQASGAHSFFLNFISYNAGFSPTGSLRKQFTPTTAAAYETFSGNLGESGWASNPFAFSGATMDIAAPNFGWMVEIQSGGGWTQSAGNTIQVDQINFTAIPEPDSVALIVLTLAVALIVRSQRRRIA